MEPLNQWRCDECGALIERRAHGVLEYRYETAQPKGSRHMNFRIVHGGAAPSGACVSEGVVGDRPLDMLAGPSAVLWMLGCESTDPSWAETFRRLAAKHYEEARIYFDRARDDGHEVIVEKLLERELVAFIEKYRD